MSEDVNVNVNIASDPAPEDDYIPLETEVSPINQVPEDTGDVIPLDKKKRKKILTTRRGGIPMQESYAATANRPYSFGTPSLTPSLEKPIDNAALAADTKNVQYKVAQYVTKRSKGFELGPGDEETIVSETEDGELVGVVAKLSNSNMILEIAVFGDTDTYYTINDLSIIEMIQEGAGLAPGDVALTGVISPDNAGNVDPVFPYVQRAKLTAEADVFGTIGEAYVVKYTPSVPFPYKAISVTIRNNSTSRGTIINARVHRIVYSIIDQEVAYSTKL